ncbi:MAG UNVERIFIED_CONTAM: hypothetical protein LVR18_51580 [Planctomycetaceae bacterium]
MPLTLTISALYRSQTDNLSGKSWLRHKRPHTLPTAIRVQARQLQSLVPMGLMGSGKIEGRAVYILDAAVHVYETFTDYDFHWLGKWHDVYRSSGQLQLRVGHPRRGRLRHSSECMLSVTKTVPVLQQVEQTVWTTRADHPAANGADHRTHRTDRTGTGWPPNLPTNRSVRVQRIAIDAGTDASFVGLTRATGGTGRNSRHSRT